MVFTTEHLQFRNSAIIHYLQPHFPCYNKSFANDSTFSKSNNNNQYSGEVKESTQKRIRKALDIFLQSSKREYIFNPVTEKYFWFRLSFITLTISSNTILEHNIAYKNLLSPFLDWLRKTKKVEFYIWKAELQERMQIHYHITTNRFILHTEIRDKWNYLQRKLGLIENSDNPPSTEIKSAKKIKSIENYLAKYISKDGADKKPMNKANDLQEICTNVSIAGSMLSCYPVSTFNDYSINGKVWDCSKNLKSNKLYSIELNSENSTIFLENKIENEIVKQIELEQCLIIKCKEGYIDRILTNDILSDYKEYLDSVKACKKFISKFDTTIKQKLITKEIQQYNKLEAKAKEVMKNLDVQQEFEFM